MLLQDYILENGLNETTFALKSGIPQPTIHRLINKKRKPGPDLAVAIERATNGQVSRFDVLWGEEKTPIRETGEK